MRKPLFAISLLGLGLLWLYFDAILVSLRLRPLPKSEPFGTILGYLLNFFDMTVALIEIICCYFSWPYSWAPFAGAWVEVRSNIGGAEMNPRLKHQVGVEHPAGECNQPKCTYIGLKWECTSTGQGSFANRLEFKM